MPGTVNQDYRYWYTLKLTSGAPAVGVADVDQTITIRNPQDTDTMPEPIITEVGSGIYYFDIDASFTDGYGAGVYGGSIVVSSSSPVVEDTQPILVEFFNNFNLVGTASLYDLYDSPIGPAIYIDTVLGAAGTVPGVNGTKSNPVSSEANAFSLATSLGLRAFWIQQGTISLTSGTSTAYQSWSFGGDYGGSVNINNKNVAGSFFSGLSISGTFNVTGNSGFDIRAVNCTVGSCTNITGQLENCFIISTLSLPNVDFFSPFEFGGGLLLMDCSNWNASITPARISVGGAVSASFVRIHGFKGRLTVQNISHASAVFEAVFDGAEVVFESSNTLGLDPKLSGIFSLTNNSSLTINTTGRVGEVVDDYIGSYTSAEGARTIYYLDPTYTGFLGIGSAGAVLGVNGTRENPVTNESDLRTLAAALGVRHVSIVAGTLTLGAAYDWWTFVGSHYGGTVALNGQGCLSSKFIGLQIQGTLGNTFSTLFDVNCHQCTIGPVSDFCGQLEDCLTHSTITIRQDGGLVCKDTVSWNAQEFPTRIDYSLGGAQTVRLQGYAGTLSVINMADASAILECSFVGAHVTIDDTTCTAGIFRPRNSAHIVGGSNLNFDYSDLNEILTDTLLTEQHGTGSWVDAGLDGPDVVGPTIIAISANPGQSVRVAVNVLNSNGELVDGYVPQIDYVINPSGQMFSGYPATMVRESVGIYSSPVDIPSGLLAVGTYIVSTSWPRPGTAFTQSAVYIINAALPFGNASVSPA
jgi:hypothetical protein